MFTKTCFLCEGAKMLADDACFRCRGRGYVLSSLGVALIGFVWVAVAIIFCSVMVGISSAATTPINPPPPGEGDTVALILSVCPDCIRLDDADAIDFSLTEGLLYGAAEDRWKYSDRDFNDWIGTFLFDGQGGAVITKLFGFSAAAQAVTFNGTYVFDAATGDPWVTTVSSNPALNPGGQVQWAFWAVRDEPPVSSVPEPSTAFQLMGCLAVAWFVWNLRRVKQ